MTQPTNKDYKKAALDHVRSVCPELMELSFGCEVYLPTLGNYKVVASHLDGRYGDHHYDLINEQGQVEELVSLDDIEIIGHTPHLEHWLRGVNESQVIPMPRMSIDGVLSCDGWAMQFNLQTGQPAQEEDYKAYCEITNCV